MKKKNFIFITTALAVSCFLIGCNKSIENTSTASTEQSTSSVETTSESIVENSIDSTESSEASTESKSTKKLLIAIGNNCQADIGMFSVIDPVTKEQINLDALANGEVISLETEWPVEVETFQWAIYNCNGDLYMEGETNISTANTNVNLLLNGNGSIEDVVESFE